MHSTVTKKGQTTLPSKLRQALHLKPGDKLSYEIEGDRVTLRVHGGTMALAGSLASSKGKNLTIKQIREAAASARVAELKKA